MYPDPPAALPAALITTVPADTSVWRIHSATRGAADLNPTPRPRVRTGGRFDSLDGSYAYLYVGDSPAAAVAETLCRNLPVDQSPRLIPRIQVRGRVLSELRTTRPVRVADLTGTGAARLNADVWLTKCDPSGYLATRRWPPPSSPRTRTSTVCSTGHATTRTISRGCSPPAPPSPRTPRCPRWEAWSRSIRPTGTISSGHCSRLTTPPSHPDPAGGGPRHRVFRALIDPDATRSAVLVEDAPDSASTHRDLP